MRWQRRDASRVHERQLRQSLTDAERVMWSVFRDRRLARWKFRRQHRAGMFILDFYCPRLRLAIELDGDPHFTEMGVAYDVGRTERLSAMGIRVLRFENRDVIDGPGLIAGLVARVAEERARELGFV